MSDERRLRNVWVTLTAVFVSLLFGVGCFAILGWLFDWDSALMRSSDGESVLQLILGIVLVAGALSVWAAALDGRPSR